MNVKSALAEAEYVAEIATENVLRHIRPTASDYEFADAIADHALADSCFPRGTYHLAVPLIDDFTGPMLPPDWRAGGDMVGVSTPDRARAKRWAEAALLAGYPLYRAYDRPRWGEGKGKRGNKGFTALYKGSIAIYREEAREHEQDRQLPESRV